MRAAILVLVCLIGVTLAMPSFKRSQAAGKVAQKNIDLAQMLRRVLQQQKAKKFFTTTTPYYTTTTPYFTSPEPTYQDYKHGCDMFKAVVDDVINMCEKYWEDKYDVLSFVLELWAMEIETDYLDIFDERIFTKAEVDKHKNENKGANHKNRLFNDLTFFNKAVERTEQMLEEFQMSDSHEEWYMYLDWSLHAHKCFREAVYNDLGVVGKEEDDKKRKLTA